MSMDPQRRLGRKITQAKLALLWEALWHAGFPALMIVGVAALAVLTGVVALLPGWAKLAVFAAAGLGLAWSLRPVLALRMPSREAALRRLETTSNMAHRPATAWNDRLADPRASGQSQALWQAHRTRMAAMLAGLRAGWPRSPLPRRDPYALRTALALGLLAALALNLSQWRVRIADAVAPDAAVAGEQASVDAWIVPPGYTQKPPLLLTGPAAERRLASQGEIVVPESSTLMVRLNGAASPHLSLARPLEDGSAGDEIAAPEMQVAGEGLHEAKAVLDRPVHVTLSDGSRLLGEWPVTLVPDMPPAAEITDEISVTPTGGFAVPWRASDDYGVAGVSGRIALAPDEALGDGALPYDPPNFSVDLPRLNPAEAEGRAFQDLTEHPWAGLTVELRLRAEDQAGQAGMSDALTFELPERRFRQPLARSLVELRRKLVRTPDDSATIVKALAALLAWPDGLIKESAHYLGIRMAASQLHQASGVGDKKEVVDVLWELALSIEDGDLSELQKELEALRRELQKALAEGAPEEEIAELMEQLRETLNRFLEAMARQMQQAMENGDMQPQQMPGQEIEAQDLQRMLDTIEELARSGSRDAAQEMLAELENILRNLQPGMAGQMSEQDQQMAEMMQQLGEMIERQQELMDETFRLPQGLEGLEGLEGMMPQPDSGEQGPGGEQGREQAEGLAGDQQSLSEMLQDLMRQLEQQGMGPPQSFGQAERSMEGAAESLRGMQRDPALGQQGEALEALREGAQAMAQQMQQMMQQGNGRQGPGPYGAAPRGDRDPLGRPVPQRGEDYGPERDMLPPEAAVERAREILEYLRNRANEATPRIERDYIDRLLRGLY